MIQIVSVRWRTAQVGPDKRQIMRDLNARLRGKRKLSPCTCATNHGWH